MDSKKPISKFKYKVEFPNREAGVKYCEKKGILAKNIRDYKKDEVIFYSSRVKTREAQILSNMYPCRLNLNGQIFKSVEHMYHYMCFTQYREIQDRIQVCRTGFEVKQMCKGLKRDDNFEEKHHDVMEFCMNLKYQQCKEFREILENSGDVPLVEWAEWGDVSAGTCLYMKGGEEWLIGQNSGGRLLMKVRLNNRKKNL